MNVRDKEGWGPLHCASFEGFLDIIDVLGKCQGDALESEKGNIDWYYPLDSRIRLNALNNNDETAWDVANDKKVKEVTGLLNCIK